MASLEGILIPFFTILIAEIGDSSFLLLAYLASKSHKRWVVLIAAISAYLIMNSFTAFIGYRIKEFIPFEILKWTAGGFFLLFGIISLRHSEEKEKAPETKMTHGKLFITTFSVIILTEIVDRSNFATAIFATQYPPIEVVIGIFSAHLITSIAAIELGKRVFKKINISILKKIGAIIFIAIGILILTRDQIL